MATVRGKCSACGVPLEVAVADPFAGTALAAALCSACTDQLFLDGGGAILQLRQQPESALFPLGKVTITSGALDEHPGRAAAGVRGVGGGNVPEAGRARVAATCFPARGETGGCVPAFQFSRFRIGDRPMEFLDSIAANGPAA